MRTRTAITIGTVTLFIAGCGGSSPTDPTAGASHSETGGAFAFSRCMRAHGADVPDPHVSVNGSQTSISQVMPASAAAAPAFKTALKACAHFQPGPQNNRADRHGPSKAALLAFARCVRAHGLTDFPDPDPEGQITPQMLSAGGIDVRGPAFARVATRCIGVTHGQITRAEIAAAASGPH